MTRAEFVAKWRTHLVGKLALGTTDFRGSCSAAFAAGGNVAALEALGAVLTRLPAEADALLGLIWDSLQPPANGTNGYTNGAPKRLAVPEKVS